MGWDFLDNCTCCILYVPCICSSEWPLIFLFRVGFLPLSRPFMNYISRECVIYRFLSILIFSSFTYVEHFLLFSPLHGVPAPFLCLLLAFVPFYTHFFARLSCNTLHIFSIYRIIVIYYIVHCSNIFYVHCF